MTRIDCKNLLLMVALVAAFIGYSSNLDLVCIRSSRAAEALPAKDRVTIENFTFVPATLTVKAGSTVTWLNHDDIPHTIVSADRHIKSAALDTDDKFTFKFDTPGAFEYFCSIHPRMTGRVVVVR